HDAAAYDAARVVLDPECRRLAAGTHFAQVAATVENRRTAGLEKANVCEAVPLAASLERELDPVVIDHDVAAIAQPADRVVRDERAVQDAAADAVAPVLRVRAGWLPVLWEVEREDLSGPDKRRGATDLVGVDIPDRPAWVGVLRRRPTGGLERSRALVGHL